MHLPENNFQSFIFILEAPFGSWVMHKSALMGEEEAKMFK